MVSFFNPKFLSGVLFERVILNHVSLPSPVVSSFMSELSPIRAELLGFLTHALLGDGLAAEYLILHLISTV